MDTREHDKLRGRLDAAEKNVSLMKELDYVVEVIRSAKYDGTQVERIAISLSAEGDKVEDEILVTRSKAAPIDGTAELGGDSVIGTTTENAAANYTGLISPLCYAGIGEELRAAIVEVFERRKAKLAAEYAGI